MKVFNNRYISNMAMLDFIFLLLVAVSSLFVILLAILQTNDSPPAIEDKNQFVIIMNWTPTADVDIDMWMLDPVDNVVSYRRKQGNGLFLQRDDLGGVNDWVEDAEGNREVVVLNEEIINIRKYVPGRYHINAHYYSNRAKTDKPIDVEIKVIKVTPFEAFAPVKAQMTIKGQELSMITMDVDEDGAVTFKPSVKRPFITQWKKHNSGSTSQNGLSSNTENH